MILLLLLLYEQLLQLRDSLVKKDHHFFISHCSFVGVLISFVGSSFDLIHVLMKYFENLLPAQMTLAAIWPTNTHKFQEHEVLPKYNKVTQWDPLTH